MLENSLGPFPALAAKTYSAPSIPIFIMDR